MSTPRTHDLRRRSWGHNIEFTRRDETTGVWSAYTWTRYRVQVGDLILHRGKLDGEPADLAYRCVEAHPVMSVDDMTKVKLEFVPAPAPTPGGKP